MGRECTWGGGGGGGGGGETDMGQELNTSTEVKHKYYEGEER